MAAPMGRLPFPFASLPMTAPESFTLATDSEIWEFTPYLNIRLPIVCVAHWRKIPAPHLAGFPALQDQHRQLTHQWRYRPEEARKLWAELKQAGAVPA